MDYRLWQVVTETQVSEKCLILYCKKKNNIKQTLYNMYVYERSFQVNSQCQVYCLRLENVRQFAAAMAASMVFFCLYTLVFIIVTLQNSISFVLICEQTPVSKFFCRYRFPVSHMLSYA